VVRYQDMETRVLDARSVLVEGEMHASGILDADVRGRIAARPGNRLSASWTGRLRGKPLDLRLESDGRTLIVRNGKDESRQAVAAEMNHAFLMGLLRMGLYHNLARGTGLRGPDRETGGVDRWIGQEYFHLVHVLGGPTPGAVILNFDVLADGFPDTTARLWLDPATGLPARREQELSLESGTVKEVETYTRFVLE
jgi:hypothetical protein